MSTEISDLDLRIWRGDSSGGDYVAYRVPVREGMVVLDAVLWVQANLASDLAVRWNCKAAKCGSCSAEIEYEVNKEIPPFTPSEKDMTSSEPWRMQQKDVERSMEFRRCIECFLCQDVCHVLRHHDSKTAFYGPRFMIRIASLEMHPKDTLDRRPLLKGKAGVAYCNITKCCTEVCPEHIKITDNAIIPLKERMDDVYFDPVRAVGRMLRGKPRGADQEED